MDTAKQFSEVTQNHIHNSQSLKLIALYAVGIGVKAFYTPAFLECVYSDTTSSLMFISSTTNEVKRFPRFARHLNILSVKCLKG